jgi:putative methanogenesis marker protein 8
MLDRFTMSPEQLIAKYRHLADVHLTRILGAWVVISRGEIVAVDRTNVLCSCPLQAMLSGANIEDYALEKIRELKQFTPERQVWQAKFGVPFGASEMLMLALRKGVIDCAITVCDGAGTVVTNVPEVVQGIGARMNGLFFTSPIPQVQQKLRSHNCILLDDAKINQVEGLQKAIEAGFTRIAVTVNARLGERLADLRCLEEAAGASVTIAAVCSTGATKDRTDEIIGASDLAWSCASHCMREAGAKAWLQVTHGIPVFIYTPRGIEFLTAYSDEAGAGVLRGLDPNKQYLLAAGRSGPEVRLGKMPLRLREDVLPVRSRNEPFPLL